MEICFPLYQVINDYWALEMLLIGRTGCLTQFIINVLKWNLITTWLVTNALDSRGLQSIQSWFVHSTWEHKCFVALWWHFGGVISHYTSTQICSWNSLWLHKFQGVFLYTQSIIFLLSVFLFWWADKLLTHSFPYVGIDLRGSQFGLRAQLHREALSHYTLDTVFDP